MVGNWETFYIIRLVIATHSHHAYCVCTLLGCTALLRFSIHLSLSADERQEKHLLPEEVVTYRKEQRNREGKRNALLLDSTHKDNRE